VTAIFITIIIITTTSSSSINLGKQVF